MKPCPISPVSTCRVCVCVSVHKYTALLWTSPEYALYGSESLGLIILVAPPETADKAWWGPSPDPP